MALNTPFTLARGFSYGIRNGATIVKNGKLTPKFAYLQDFSEGK